jgi:hypothetical protein
MDSLAAVAGERHPVRAACLWSAAARFREELGAPLSPVERSRRDSQIAGARAALADDATFDRAWAEGSNMTLEQAVEFAVQESNG